MLILSSAPRGVALAVGFAAIAVVIALVVAIAVVLVKFLGKKKARNEEAIQPEEEVAEVPAATQPVAPGSAGSIKLHDVEPKTAAMLMAIVADKMGKPINELRFISIKEIK